MVLHLPVGRLTFVDLCLLYETVRTIVDMRARLIWIFACHPSYGGFFENQTSSRDLTYRHLLYQVPACFELNHLVSLGPS